MIARRRWRRGPIHEASSDESALTNVSIDAPHRAFESCPLARDARTSLSPGPSRNL
jgi:hypothetical protein